MQSLNELMIGIEFCRSQDCGQCEFIPSHIIEFTLILFDSTKLGLGNVQDVDSVKMVWTISAKGVERSESGLFMPCRSLS